MKNKIIKTSKFLSFVLRHQPEAIGLELDNQGWAFIDELIKLAEKEGKVFDRNLIEEVVRTNDKKRFVISEDGKKIRANQGHSVEIDLGLESTNPPQFLFHGTATRFLDAIFKEGLKPSGRQHVHLSVDKVTATKVGMRHGSPVILQVEAEKMHMDGFKFYVSENGVWLTEKIIPKYFSILEH